MHRYWVICAMLCALMACSQGQEKGADYKLASESTLTEAQKGQVVAQIGKRLITLEDFEAQLNEKSPFVRARYNSASRKREFLDSLVRFELLAHAAEEKGYGKDPDVILAKKQAMVRRFVAKEVAQLVKMADVTKDDIAAYYEKHKSDYHRPAQVRAAHILVAEEAAALAVIREIKKATTDPKVDRLSIFRSWVRKMSIDKQTKSRKGDLGFFGEPGVGFVKRAENAPIVPPPVAKAAFTITTVGDIHSAPIKTSQGWHVIQKTGYRRPYNKAVAAVRNKIRNAVFRQKKTKAMRDYVEKLKSKVTVQVNEDVLKKVKAKRRLGPPTPFGPPKLPSLKPQGGSTR